MHQWEQYKAQPHDHWWANFVHAARLRTDELRQQLGPDAKITWLVYKQGYIDRATQEKQDLISHIESVRDKYNLNLVWFNRGEEVISYLNRGQDRTRVKVAGFEFFGHSNKACFMFDYSSNLDSASKSWLHESDLVENRSPYFRARRLCQKLGLPHRRGDVPTLVQRDRHENDRRVGQDPVHDGRTPNP